MSDKTNEGDDFLFEEVELFNKALIQGGSTFAPWTSSEATESADH